MRNKIAWKVVLIFLYTMSFPFTGKIEARTNITLISPNQFEEVPGLGDPKVTEIAKNVLAVMDLYHSAEGKFYVNAGIIITDLCPL